MQYQAIWGTRHEGRHLSMHYVPGELCPFAHGSAQLRTEAAVALGKLPPDYKCRLCPGHHRNNCPHKDRCYNAHGVQELRCRQAAQPSVLGWREESKH